ncbi:hypothetical protein FDP41_007982 [Naegleria fowleri]|uniref:Uncharacterized protein n=1 Tax=Naegleria fowleri TaxID=5763 RepID=A0A6A5C3Z3_NAEFO|nr:uncharacterized protein FDP41_007982 [Naegleria fowleri]KAF0984067.1 hypothetical protein FDP41_007982 [Naegleria fowleri]
MPTKHSSAVVKSTSSLQQLPNNNINGHPNVNNSKNSSSATTQNKSIKTKKSKNSTIASPQQFSTPQTKNCVESSSNSSAMGADQDNSLSKSLSSSPTAINHHEDVPSEYLHGSEGIDSVSLINANIQIEQRKKFALKKIIAGYTKGITFLYHQKFEIAIGCFTTSLGLKQNLYFTISKDEDDEENSRNDDTQCQQSQETPFLLESTLFDDDQHRQDLHSSLNIPELLCSSLPLSPCTFTLYILRAIAFIGHHVYSKAVVDCDSVLRQNSSYHSAYIIKGHALICMRKYKEAYMNFTALLEQSNMERTKSSHKCDIDFELLYERKEDVFDSLRTLHGLSYHIYEMSKKQNKNKNDLDVLDQSVINIYIYCLASSPTDINCRSMGAVLLVDYIASAVNDYNHVMFEYFEKIDLKNKKENKSVLEEIFEEEEERSLILNGIDSILDSLCLWDDQELKLFSTRAVTDLCNVDNDCSIRRRIVQYEDGDALRQIIQQLSLIDYIIPDMGENDTQLCELLEASVCALAAIARGGTSDLSRTIYEMNGLIALSPILLQVSKSLATQRPPIIKAVFIAQCYAYLSVENFDIKEAIVSDEKVLLALYKLSLQNIDMEAKNFAIITVGNSCQNPECWGKPLLLKQISEQVNNTLISKGYLELLVEIIKKKPSATTTSTAAGNSKKKSSNIDASLIELQYNAINTMTGLLGFESGRKRFKKNHGEEILTNIILESKFEALREVSSKARTFYITLNDYGDNISEYVFTKFKFFNYSRNPELESSSTPYQSLVDSSNTNNNIATPSRSITDQSHNNGRNDNAITPTSSAQQNNTVPTSREEIIKEETLRFLEMKRKGELPNDFNEDFYSKLMNGILGIGVVGMGPMSSSNQQDHTSNANQSNKPSKSTLKNVTLSSSSAGTEEKKPPKSATANPITNAPTKKTPSHSHEKSPLISKDNIDDIADLISSSPDKNKKKKKKQQPSNKKKKQETTKKITEQQQPKKTSSESTNKLPITTSPSTVQTKNVESRKILQPSPHPSQKVIELSDDEESTEEEEEGDEVSKSEKGLKNDISASTTFATSSMASNKELRGNSPSLHSVIAMGEDDTTTVSYENLTPEEIFMLEFEKGMDKLIKELWYT